MNKKIKILSVITLLIGISILLSGCVGDELAPIANLPILNNDLENGKITFEKEIDDFIFITEYSTSYDTSTWRITDSKYLIMNAKIKNLPENTTILVEHVHVDICLKSVKAQLDGWTQDSMDDKLHTGSQLGFWITDEYSYENIFAIEGFSQTLISGWGFFLGGYGSLTTEEKRLTEKNLVDKGGVYGNKIQIVYDLLIKYPNDQYFHTKSVIDEFLVPVNR